MSLGTVSTAPQTELGALQDLTGFSRWVVQRGVSGEPLPSTVSHFNTVPAASGVRVTRLFKLYQERGPSDRTLGDRVSLIFGLSKAVMLI